MSTHHYSASDEALFLEAAFNGFVKNCDEQALHIKTTHHASEQLKVLLHVTSTLRETVTALQGQLQAASSHHLATYNKLREESQTANEKLRDELEVKHSAECKVLRERLTTLQGRMDEVQQTNSRLQTVKNSQQFAIEELRDALGTNTLRLQGDSESLAEVKKDLRQIQADRESLGVCLEQLIHRTANRDLLDPHDAEDWAPPGPLDTDSNSNVDLELSAHSFAAGIGGDINTETQHHIKAYQTRSTAPTQYQNRSQDSEFDNKPSAVARGQQRTPSPARDAVHVTDGPANQEAYQELHPRAKLIVDHYFSVKAQYSAAIKDEAKFVRAYIKEFKDPEFIEWFQEYLLKLLPANMVRRTKRRPHRQPGSINVVFTNKVTWEAVKEATKSMDPEEFLKV